MSPQEVAARDTSRVLVHTTLFLLLLLVLAGPLLGLG